MNPTRRLDLVTNFQHLSDLLFELIALLTHSHQRVIELEPIIIVAEKRTQHSLAGQQHPEDRLSPDLFRLNPGVVEFERLMLCIRHLDEAVNESNDVGV